MKRKKTILTPEQIAFRESLLPKKNRRRLVLKTQKQSFTIDGQIRSHLDYADNCIWWINECIEGRQNRYEFSLSVKALRCHMEQIEILLKKEDENSQNKNLITNKS